MAKIKCVACEYPYRYSHRTAIKTLVYKKGDTVDIEYLEDRYIATATRDMYNIDVKCTLCDNLNNHFNATNEILYNDYNTVENLEGFGWSLKKRRKYKKKIIKKEKMHKFLFFRF